jgi:hypothetical protein
MLYVNKDNVIFPEAQNFSQVTTNGTREFLYSSPLIDEENRSKLLPIFNDAYVEFSTLLSNGGIYVKDRIVTREIDTSTASLIFFERLAREGYFKLNGNEFSDYKIFRPEQISERQGVYFVSPDFPTHLTYKINPGGSVIFKILANNKKTIDIFQHTFNLGNHISTIFNTRQGIQRSSDRVPGRIYLNAGVFTVGLLKDIGTPETIES